MVGSIALPIMTGAGIQPIDAVNLVLLGMMIGSSMNFAASAAGVGIFGPEAVLKYFIPRATISLMVTAAYIVINIPRGESSGASITVLLKRFAHGLLSVPASLVRAIRKIFTASKSALIKKKQPLPSVALISPAAGGYRCDKFYRRAWLRRTRKN